MIGDCYDVFMTDPNLVGSAGWVLMTVAQVNDEGTTLLYPPLLSCVDLDPGELEALVARRHARPAPYDRAAMQRIVSFNLAERSTLDLPHDAEMARNVLNAPFMRPYAR